MASSDAVIGKPASLRPPVQLAARAWRFLNSASLEAIRGHEPSCRAFAARAGVLAVRTGWSPLEIGVDHVLGLLELSQGNPGAAVWHLMRCRALAAQAKVADPYIVRFEPDLLETLVALGRSAEAELVAASLETRAGRFSTPWSLAAAARCRGILAPDASFAQHFERALKLSEQAASPFDRARTMLCFGERLRRTRRRAEARAHLSRALEAFQRLDASPWAERAARELQATARTSRLRDDPRNVDALTPQERHVVRIVAEGATVREAAARMFLSPKTVEAHLGRAYRKLGVHNRAQLASLLARGEHPLGRLERQTDVVGLPLSAADSAPPKD
jgi:DNA-binding CsgD family transcriptional regulator